MAKNDFDSLGFKPINDDDLSAIGFKPVEPAIPEYKDAPGSIEAGLRGLEQGATLGFGDEINSALSTLLNQATGQSKDLGILDEYRKQLAESRESFKAAEDAHPYISGAANLAGGLAPALLTGGASLPAQGIRGAAKLGAMYGAVGGLGTSEADLTKGELGEAAKDVATGGVLGGLLGGGVHAGAEKFGQTLKNAGMTLGGAAKDIARTPVELPFIAEPLEAFSLGLKGEKLYGDKAGKALQQRAIEAEKGLGELLGKAGSEASSAKTSALLSAEQQVDMMPWIKGTNQMSKTIREQESADPQVVSEMGRVMNYVQRYLQGNADEKLQGKLSPEGTINPADLDRFRRKLAEWSSAGDNALKTREVRAFVTRLLSPLERDANITEAALGIPKGFPAIKPMLEKAVPELKELNPRISQIEQAKEKIPSLSELMNFEKSSQSGTGAMKSLDEFFNTAPKDLFTGKREELGQLADAVDIATKMRAPGLGHGMFGSSVRGGTLTGANMGGVALRGLYNMAPEGVKELSAKVAQTGTETAKKLSTMLSAASEKDNVGRNALFFAIQQNPEYRRILNEATGNQEPEAQ